MDKVWFGKILERKSVVVENESLINVSLIKDLKSCFTKAFSAKMGKYKQIKSSKNIHTLLKLKYQLAFAFCYYLSSLSFAVTAEKKKKPGEENMLSKKKLIVQKLSSEPKPTTMKFVSEGPREFVEYNYDKILLDNIKEACTQHFKEKRNCDVLDSEQGPSCTRLDQLPSLRLIFIRFTTPKSIKNSDSASESWTRPPPMKKAKSFVNKKIEKKSFIPKILSVNDMMKLGKIIRENERSSAKSLIEKFNMENNEWYISKKVIFENEDKAFTEGDGIHCRWHTRLKVIMKASDEIFRRNAWTVKKYSTSLKEKLEKMGEICESQSR